MSSIGAVHLIFSLIAIVCGAVVLMLPKGTRWHRTWGHGYVWCMLGVVVTSFAMYNMTGRWGPFHIAAAVAGLTLLAAMYTVLLRRPKKTWIGAHATWMAWSYVGLMGGFTAETLSRFVMPYAETYLQANQLYGVFWSAVGLATAVTFISGWWLIKSRLPGAIAGTPDSMRAERRELTAEADR